MTRILVVGGAGYIGSHTCRALARSGYEPVSYDDLSTGHAEFVQWGPLVRADMLDADALTSAMREFRPAAVVHFAARAYVGESVEAPGLYYAQNVGGVVSVLEAMRQVGCEHIVLSSSCAVYGQPGTPRISEATPPSPINPYGRTKLVCEWMLRDFEQAHGTRSVALRYFNAAGASADGGLGEWRDPEPHLIPRALLRILDGQFDFDVFGTDYPTPDGTAIRDYIHVEDLADGHVAAVRHLLSGAASATVNLGTGQGHSVRQVLETIGRITGHELRINAAPRRAGDPPELVADAGLAGQLLGFVPRQSSLDNIIASAWNWHRGGHRQRLAAAIA